MLKFQGNLRWLRREVNDKFKKGKETGGKKDFILGKHHLNFMKKYEITPEIVMSKMKLDLQDIDELKKQLNMAFLEEKLEKENEEERKRAKGPKNPVKTKTPSSSKKMTKEEMEHIYQEAQKIYQEEPDKPTQTEPEKAMAVAHVAEEKKKSS